MRLELHLLVVTNIDIILENSYCGAVSMSTVVVVVVVVVVVDSHIQHIVLATEDTTVTQQVSHGPIKCQSRLWSQRGIKVNGSYHGDKTRYSDQQGSKSRQKVMHLYKHRHRPMSKRFIIPPYSIPRATSIDSDCCHLPTTTVLSTSKRTSYGPISFDQQVQISQDNTSYKNKEN